MKITNLLALVFFPTASLAFAPQLGRKMKASLSTVSSQSKLAIASNPCDNDESIVQDPMRRMTLIALPASILLGISEEDEVEASEQILLNNIESSSQIVAPVEVTPLPGVGFGGMGFGPFGFSPFGGFGAGFTIRSTPPPPSPDVALQRSKAALEANKLRQAQLEQQIKELEKSERPKEQSKT